MVVSLREDANLRLHVISTQQSRRDRYSRKTKSTDKTSVRLLQVLLKELVPIFRGLADNISVLEPDYAHTRCVNNENAEDSSWIEIMMTPLETSASEPDHTLGCP